MRLFGHKLTVTAQIGLLIIAINVVMAVIGPMVAPYAQEDAIGDAWDPASAAYWLGLDQIGRDIFSRLLFGARTSIGLALIITALSFTLGIIAGFTAAVAGRWVDVILSRFVDLMLSMPTLIFAFIVLSVLGTDIPVLIATIAILDSTKVFRLARAVAMNIVVLDFVEAAKLRGEGLWWVIRREVLKVTDMRIQARSDRGLGPVLVHDVSFTLRRGEVLGLIGESGAGKSTIGLASLGYTRRGCFIAGGEIVFNGKDIRQMSLAQRQELRGHGVAYIAQSAAASFNPAMTLYEQVCEVP